MNILCGGPVNIKGMPVIGEGMNKYFDDFEIGYTEEAGPYYLAEDEIIEFAKKYDPAPFHVDASQAEKSIYNGLTASSAVS